MIHIVCISDLHNEYKKLLIPECDLLLCAGDVSNRGMQFEIERFLDWFSEQPAKYKVFIAGNHDWLFFDYPLVARELLKSYPDIIYLENKSITIMNLKIWGSPNQPWYHDWAFNFPQEHDEYQRAARKLYDTIPEDTNIIITHGPIHGTLDISHRGNINVGCSFLLEAIERIKPSLHLCGHIHESYGMVEKEHTLFVNAAINNFGGELHPITELWFDPITKEFF